MDSFDENAGFDENSWDLIDYSNLIDDVAATDFFWVNDSVVPFGAMSQDKECAEKECSRKRGRNDSCSRVGTKACRERQRRERLNDRFLELSCTLEPGRPATTDKLAIIGDAIRVLNQLKTESQEYKETNEKLQEEIRTLKRRMNFVKRNSY